MTRTLPWVPETFLARFPVSVKSLVPRVRELGRKFKIERRDQFSIFVFGIRIDQSIGVQMTKETEGRIQVLKSPGGDG